MNKHSFTLIGFPRENVLELKIFALPDYTPQHYIYERYDHPYIQNPTPKVQSNSHYQHYFISELTTFAATIMEGRSTKTALVQIDPAGLKLEVEECCGLQSMTRGDIFDIVSCFSFTIHSQKVELINLPDHSLVNTARKPHILVKYLANGPTQALSLSDGSPSTYEWEGRSPMIFKR